MKPHRLVFLSTAVLTLAFAAIAVAWTTNGLSEAEEHYNAGVEVSQGAR